MDTTEHKQKLLYFEGIKNSASYITIIVMFKFLKVAECI